MNTQQRAERFALYVALELKGKITTMGHTANDVADAIGRPRATMNRWLNGKLPIPLSVVGAASEFIDVDPNVIVGYAYDRLCVELGERDGTTYDDPDISAPIELNAHRDVAGPGDDASVRPEDQLEYGGRKTLDEISGRAADKGKKDD